MRRMALLFYLFCFGYQSIRSECQPPKPGLIWPTLQHDSGRVFPKTIRQMALARLALFYGHVMVGIVGSQIFCSRPDEAIVVELLDHVRCPAADAGDGEYRRK